MGEEGRKRKEKEEVEEERSSPFSRFFGNQTVGFRRSKKRSSSTRRELHIEIRIRVFRQTPRGRGFPPTWINSCLRSIQMVEIVGAGTIVHFSPKDLRLNTGFSRLFLDSPN